MATVKSTGDRTRIAGNNYIENTSVNSLETTNNSSTFNTFISHAQQDIEVATIVYKALNNHASRLNPIFFGSTSIRTGEIWRNAIENALQVSNHHLVIVTPGSIDAPWIMFETGFSMKANKTPWVIRSGGLTTEMLHGHPLEQFQSFSLEQENAFESLILQFYDSLGEHVNLSHCRDELNDLQSQIHK